MKALFLAILDLVPGSLYFYYLKHGNRDLYAPAVVTRQTCFVIDGFPRCANTFTYYYLQTAFGQSRIAHHIHSWQQFLFAAILGKPAYRLIREPDAAVASIRNKQGRSIALCYFQYAVFYTITNALPNTNVSFEVVTAGGGLEDLAALISKQTGLKNVSVRMAEVDRLLERRTNHKNRPTFPLNLENLTLFEEMLRKWARNSYKKANVRNVKCLK